LIDVDFLLRFEFGNNASWVPAPNKYNLKGEIEE